jgi:hypothetical protein
MCCHGNAGDIIVLPSVHLDKDGTTIKTKAAKEGRAMTSKAKRMELP